MQKIVPCGWFNHNGLEAAEFYTTVFPDTTILATSYYPTEDLPEFQQKFAGKPLVVDLSVAGFRIALINAGDTFRPNPALNFMVNFDPSKDPQAEEKLREVWGKLTAEGRELIPLEEYPFSPLYSWVEDKYGMSWQLMLSKQPAPAFIMPSFLFAGQAQNKAREAVEKYVGLFSDAKVGTIIDWDKENGPAKPDSVLFSDFQLAGQYFSAMDSGVDADFTFTPGVSLMINCDNQEEIDYFWDALSTVPEAEMCGWCVDEFGVSWQVVPTNFEELLKRPGAYQNMLKMKKLIIADY